MKNPLIILVVEDNDSHRRDAAEMFRIEHPRLPIHSSLHFTESLAGAMAMLPHVDAVMTDVFFPDVVGADADMPNGQKILEACIAAQKPVVWVTSTYHHGAKTDDVNHWGRQRGFEMFDCAELAGPNRDKEGAHKPWKAALYGLLYTVLALEMDALAFEDGKLVSGPQQGDHVVYPGISLSTIGAWRWEEPSDPVIRKMSELGIRHTE